MNEATLFSTKLFFILFWKTYVIIDFNIHVTCRSSVLQQWPVPRKLFSLDVMYLHGKPGSESNSQKVYDALVGAVEQVIEDKDYIFKSGLSLPRVSSATCICCCRTPNNIAFRIILTYLSPLQINQQQLVQLHVVKLFQYQTKN